jgi:hypothetical protein
VIIVTLYVHLLTCFTLSAVPHITVIRHMPWTELCIFSP